MMDAFKDMYDVVVDRRANPQEGSYTCYLFDKGIDKILKKCGEECTEMVIAAKNSDKDELANEINDLLYHMIVMNGRPRRDRRGHREDHGRAQQEDRQSQAVPCERSQHLIWSLQDLSTTTPTTSTRWR